jgi:hypothetical protein
LRLPFRHIGAARHEFNLVLQPAKMNFAVANAHRYGKGLSCANEKLTAFAELESATRERGV